MRNIGHIETLPYMPYVSHVVQNFKFQTIQLPKCEYRLQSPKGFSNFHLYKICLAYMKRSILPCLACLMLLISCNNNDDDKRPGDNKKDTGNLKKETKTAKAEVAAKNLPALIL